MLLLSGSVLISIGTEDASAAQVTGTIALDQDVVTAHVGPGEDGIVEFTGTVTVDSIGPGENVQTIEVSLTASSDWPATITPSSMMCSASQVGTPMPFEVTVRVPNFADATTVGEVVVNGRIRTVPGALYHNLAPATGVIEIAPYAILYVRCDEPVREARSGDTAAFTLDVKNDGNYYANVSTELEDDEDWMFRGWNIDFPINDISLDIGASETIWVRASVPGNADDQTYALIFRFTSLSGNDTDDESYKLFINVTESRMEKLGDTGKDEFLKTAEDDNGRSIAGFEIFSLFMVLCLFSLVGLRKLRTV